MLWTGSDDGRVHLSRNGGTSWDDVTPAAMVKHTRITGIEPSRFDPAVAYVSATRYQLDDFRPYVYKTADYGKTWTRIDAGLPMGAYARSIREDVVRRGLLFAATEVGVFVSFNDGTSWEPLQLNLPRVSVRDLRVHGNDLVIGTHGRAFWALDDIASLRQLHDSVRVKKAHLFTPSLAYRFAGGHGGGRGAGENPYDGVLVDYWFKDAPKEALIMEFLDARGAVVRRFKSAAFDSAKVPADSLAYQASDSVVSRRAGSNRFWWNLRYADAKRARNVVNDMGTFNGPTAVPGEYRVRLIVGTDTLSQAFTVKLDPRLDATTADLQQTFDLGIKVQDRLNSIVESFDRIEDLQKQIDVSVAQSLEQAYAKQVKDAAKPVRDRLEIVRTELVDWYNHDDQATLHFPIKLYNMMLSLNSQVLGQEAAPNKQHGEILDELGGKVDVQLQRLRQLENTELAALNVQLQQLGLPPIFIPPVPGKKPIS